VIFSRASFASWLGGEFHLRFVGPVELRVGPAFDDNDLSGLSGPDNLIDVRRDGFFLLTLECPEVFHCGAVGVWQEFAAFHGPAAVGASQSVVEKDRAGPHFLLGQLHHIDDRPGHQALLAASPAPADPLGARGLKQCIHEDAVTTVFLESLARNGRPPLAKLSVEYVVLLEFSDLVEDLALLVSEDPIGVFLEFLACVVQRVVDEPVPVEQHFHLTVEYL